MTISLLIGVLYYGDDDVNLLETVKLLECHIINNVYVGT